MQSGELAGTACRPAVLPQERLQIGPVLAFAPSKSQTSRPATLCFFGRLRTGVNDQADWMNVLPAVKVEQLCDAASRMLGRLGALQLRIKLKNGCQITVKFEPFPRRKTPLLQVFKAGDSLAEKSI
jgi:hypothetical protein